MADQALKSIPNKALRKIVRQGKLSALIASDEGRHYFNLYLESHPEFVKYWNFYELVVQISKSGGIPQQLDVGDQCFKKHIALEADSEDRVDSLIDRSGVNELKKALVSCRKDSTSPVTAFQPLQKSSLEYLDQQIFRPYLIPILDTEKNSRPGCNLS